MELYTCEQCNETFKNGWSDDECITEASREFPDLDDEDCVIVCEPCYIKIMIFNKHPGFEE